MSIKFIDLSVPLDDSPAGPEPAKIKYSAEQINRLLGIKISESQAIQYLTRLGFKVENETAEVPSWRSRDVTIWQDLAEEVSRLYGFEKIKKTVLPKQKPVCENKEWQTEQKVKDFLVNLGFTEVESYPYLSATDLENAGFDPKKCLEIENPLSPETQ